MNDALLLIAVIVGLVLFGYALDLPGLLRMSRELEAKRAWLYGWDSAREGFGREDYPIDYTDAEREAWQRGWDEYHARG